MNFNNRVFSTQNLEKLITTGSSKRKSTPLLDQEAYSHVKDVYKDSTQVPNKTTGGYIKVEISTEKNEKEAFLKWLDYILPELISRFGYGKIAILLRTNAHVEMVSKHLLSKEIPVISKANLDVRNHYVVRAITNLLEFLDFPPDNLSFAKFLSSEPFKILVNINFEDWLLKKRELQENPLYSEFRSDFSDFWDKYLDELFRSVGYLPPYDLVWQITEKLKLFENFPEAEAFTQKFMEVIYNLEENGALSLKDIIERIHNSPRELFSLDMPEQGEAIVVSTIHSAKGLEFEVVITWPVRSKLGGSREIKFYNAGTASFAFKPEKIYTEFNRKLDLIHKETVALETIDELNNLYVAATRAKSELYIYFPKNSNFKMLFDEFPEFGAPVEITKEKEEISLSSRSNYRLKNWYNKLANTITKPFELKEPVRRGDLVHRVLARIEKLEFLPEELHFPVYMKEIIKIVSEELGFSNFDPEELYLSFHTFFDKKDVQKFFTGGIVFTEKEIFSEDGEHLRIDRVVIRNHEIDVIEFKTGEPELSKHRYQVMKYMDTMRKLHPDKKVRGYIIYFDKVRIVEV